MATTIFHESTELKGAAIRMGKLIETIVSIKGAMTQIHNKDRSIWIGKAADQHDRNFRKLTQITDNWLTDARQTKTALDEAVAAYEKVEQMQVTKVGQLDTTGIFS